MYNDIHIIYAYVYIIIMYRLIPFAVWKTKSIQPKTIYGENGNSDCIDAESGPLNMSVAIRWRYWQAIDINKQPKQVIKPFQTSKVNI